MPKDKIKLKKPKDKAKSGEGKKKRKKKKSRQEEEEEEELYTLQEEAEEEEMEEEVEQTEEEQTEEELTEEETEEEQTEEEGDDGEGAEAGSSFRIKAVKEGKERAKGKGGKASSGFVRQKEKPAEVAKEPPGGMAKFRKKAAKAKAKRKQAAGDDEEMEIFKVAFDKDGKPAKRVVNKKKEKKRPVDPRMERSKLLMEALEMMPGPEEVEQPTEEEQEKIDKESLYATHKVQPRPPSRGVNEDQLEKRVAPISFTVEKEDGSHAFIKEGEVVVLLADNDPDDKWWRGYPQGRVEDTGEFKKDVLELERKMKTGPMGTPLPEEPAAEVAPLQEQPALPAPERAVVDVAPPLAPAPPEPEPEPEPEPAPAPARVPLEPEPVPVPVPQPALAQPPAPTSRPAQPEPAKPDRTDQPEPEPEPVRKQRPMSGGAVRSAVPQAAAQPAAAPSPQQPIPTPTGGENFQDMLQSGLQCVYVQRFDEAIALFKRCRQLNLTDPTPAYNLACCYSLKRDIDSGIRWLTVAVDLGLDYEDLSQDPDLENMFEDPRFQEIWDRMRNLSADELAAVDAGQALPAPAGGALTTSMTQQYPQVLKNDGDKAEATGGTVEGPDEVFENRLQDGVEAVARGDTQEAVRCFESCLRLRPEDAACAYNLTCCHALMGEVDKAVSWFGRAVQWGLADVAGLDPARDPDLSSLMSNSSFQELMQELKQRQRQVESGGSPPVAPPAAPYAADAQSSEPKLNSSLGAQSWSAEPASSISPTQPQDSRSFSSAPVGFDQAHPPPSSGPFGHETSPAWYGLEQHPKDVLGQSGVSQQLPGVRRGSAGPERTSSLRRWQAATHQLPHDPEEWALVHVAHWLKQLGLGKYVEKFEEQDIRGDVLLDLTSQECEQVLGIRVLGHRKLLLKSLEYLRKQSKVDRDLMFSELQQG